LDLCKRIKEIRGNSIPIICLTVISDSKIIQDFKDIGVTLVINKPVLPSIVLNSVITVLQQRFQIPDPEEISKEISRREFEFKVGDSNTKIRALWALSQLSHYDFEVINLVNRLIISEENPLIKGLGESIVTENKNKNLVDSNNLRTGTPKRIELKEITMPNYDVFLSYKSCDQEFALKLKRALNGLSIKVWIDKDEIRPGDLFAQALENGLENSSCGVLIVSPESLSSGWVKDEYYRMISLANSKNGNYRLIPIILKDSEFPGFLTNRQYVDFRDDYKFSENIHKLYYGITGRKI
jgi:hypothetical protein